MKGGGLLVAVRVSHFSFVSSLLFRRNFSEARVLCNIMQIRLTHALLFDLCNLTCV